MIYIEYYCTMETYKNLIHVLASCDQVNQVAMSSYYHLGNSHMTTFELLLPSSIHCLSLYNYYNWEEKNLEQMKTSFQLQTGAEHSWSQKEQVPSDG